MQAFMVTQGHPLCQSMPHIWLPISTQ